MPSPFSLAVEQDAATLEFRLTGEFDLACIGRVEAELDRVSSSTRDVVFDLRDVSFLDIAALMTLLRADERSHVEGFQVQIVPPKGPANRVFTLTRAGSALTMVDRHCCRGTSSSSSSPGEPFRSSASPRPSGSSGATASRRPTSRSWCRSTR